MSRVRYIKLGLLFYSYISGFHVIDSGRPVWYLLRNGSIYDHLR